MVKINISELKAKEDAKTQLKQQIAKAKEEVRILKENFRSTELEEAKKSVFDSFENYFNTAGFNVSRNDNSELTASYGEQKIEIVLDDNIISVVHNSKTIEDITISTRKSLKNTVISSYSSSSNKDNDILNLEFQLESLQKEIANLKEVKIYYHYSLGTDLDFSNVIANIFK